jgi:hydroxyacylglutathione hydrolase
MIHEVLPVGVFEQNCAILADESSREAFLIDPGDEPGLILQRIEELGVTVKAILITHAHLDHVGALAETKEALGVEAFMHPGELDLYANVPSQAQKYSLRPPKMSKIENDLADGQILKLGAYDFHCLLTPGHSPASISFYIPQAQRVIAGDTLFRRAIGRTDLQGGNEATLLKSIRTKLLTLPPETMVFPGHGAETTVEDEARHNPFLASGGRARR